MPNKLLSVSEAAEMLGLSKHTLNQWKSQGRIPFIKLGRRTCLTRMIWKHSLLTEGLSLRSTIISHWRGLRAKDGPLTPRNIFLRSSRGLTARFRKGGYINVYISGNKHE